MEWMNKGERPTPIAQPTAVSGVRKSSNQKNSKLMGWATLVILIGATLIAALAVLYFSVYSGNGGENRYVSNKKLQAVFLNGGQVYFGNIKNLNEKYLRMDNIYYLRVNQTVQPNGSSASNQDISLVKLGCELHGPTDEMLINRDQVVFWENLKSDGQVAKAVDAYVKQNPNGQNCSQANQSTSTSSTPASTGGAATTGAPTTTGTTGSTGNNSTTGTSTTKKP